MPFTFRRPTLDDAEMLLAWRTDPAITRYMLTDITPDIKRQREWLRACESRTDYEHFVMEREGRPIGYVSFSDIDRVNRHCVPGTYTVLAPPERHLAAYTNSFILDYCFYKLEMNKAIFTIMAGNDNFLKAKRLMGVREIGVLRQHVLKYERFHDLHMFELMRDEWVATRRLFSLATTLGAFAV